MTMNKPFASLNPVGKGHNFNVRGFSLIEILIAMVVLSVGILAVTKMELVSMRSNTRSASLTEASSVARATMDRLLNLDYDAAELSDTSADSTAGLTDATPSTADYHQTDGRFDIFWNVAENQPINNCKTIQVNVTWNMGGEVKSTSFSAIKNR